MTNEQHELKQTLLSYIRNGLCALPANSKQKRPVVSWKQFQDRIPTDNEVDNWFNSYNNIDAIAIICGAVSGNLEVIDFDWGGRSLEDWGEQVLSLGLDYSQFPIEETQSHGYHVFYRSTSDVEGNTKLTWANFGEDEMEDVMGKKYYHGKEVLKGKDGTYGGCTIETRGEGGLIICAPSAGYKMFKGSWLDIPVLDRRDVLVLKKAATNLSTASLEPPKRESTWSAPVVVTPTSFSSADYLRQTNATAEILARNGWTFVGFYNGDGNCELWRRPGKSHGVSGLRHADDGRFHVWTTSTELDGGRMYSPLQLLAALEYGGNENVASRAVFDLVAPKGLGSTPSYLMDTSYLSYTWDSLVASTKGDSPVVEEEKKEEKPFEFKSRRALLESYPKLPKKLRNLGPNSFFTMFKDKCEQDSGITQDELYFASAMVTLAHIVGDKVHHGSAYPNLYCICTAESGCGKNAPLSHARKVANFFDERSVTNGFQSEQVMGDMFREKSKLIWIQDEFGQWLNRAYQKGKPCSMQYDVLRQCTDLWSKAGQIVMTGASRKNKELSKDESIGNKGVNEMTYKAYLSILNYTTPSSLQEFMNTAASECGTIARFFFPIGNAAPSKKRCVRGDNEPTDAEKAVCMEWRDLGSIHKEEVAADFGDFEDVSSDIPENFDYIPYNGFEIPVDKDADAYLDKIWADYDERAVRARFGESDEENLKEMLARSYEFVEKFAMIFACDKYGTNLNELRIDKECVELANEYQEYCIDCEKYLFNLISNNKTASESDLDKKLERMCSKVRQKDGTVTWRMRDFTQAFRDKFTRDKVIQFLVESEVATPREVESQLAKGAVRKCTVFEIDCKKLREVC